MAVNTNLTFYRGEDVLVTLTQTTSTVSIAGWNFRIQIWTLAAGLDGTPLVDSSQASGASIVFAITDATNGSFTMLLPSALTLALPRGQYWYEVRRIDAGHNTELAWGFVLVGPPL